MSEDYIVPSEDEFYDELLEQQNELTTSIGSQEDYDGRDWEEYY